VQKNVKNHLSNIFKKSKNKKKLKKHTKLKKSAENLLKITSNIVKKSFWIELAYDCWYSFSTNSGSGNPFPPSFLTYLSPSSRNLITHRSYSLRP